MLIGISRLPGPRLETSCRNSLAEADSVIAFMAVEVDGFESAARRMWNVTSLYIRSLSALLYGVRLSTGRASNDGPFFSISDILSLDVFLR